jgi:hypothetical protein
LFYATRQVFFEKELRLDKKIQQPLALLDPGGRTILGHQKSRHTHFEFYKKEIYKNENLNFGDFLSDF